MRVLNENENIDLDCVVRDNGSDFNLRLNDALVVKT